MVISGALPSQSFSVPGDLGPDGVDSAEADVLKLCAQEKALLSSSGHWPE